MGVAVSLGFLGPFELRVDGGEAVPLGGRRQRALLLVLALHANEAVSTDRLVDELWGENPPKAAVHTIQVFVSRLRRALGAAGNRLITSPPGYLLQVGAQETDADLCAQCYANARAALSASEPTRAAALLNEAQALWRGPPLADFTYEPFAQATIARLEELRISCREELIDAELAGGCHAEIISELEALVREHPLRERPRGQLMLALYRCGRQAEALDAYQQARRMLVEELAIEPSAALRELEQAILRQDESLLAPSPPAEIERPLAAEAPTESSERLEAPPAPEPTPAAPVAEPSSAALVRKIVTVVVGRIAGSGPMGQVDPETARRVIAHARERAQQIVTTHGGTFVPALGGEVVGVFGLPLTKEDDAIRALRAAKEVRQQIAALNDAEQGELAVAVGVDTGEVIAEGPEDMFGEPLGGAITLARSAQDAEVLISAATYRAASPAIRGEPALGGSAWRLLDLIADARLRLRRVGNPMVNRHDEMATARAAFARAAGAGEARLLTVLGEPGIGKSRLSQELAELLADQATVLTGGCLSYGEGIAFWPLREALADFAGDDSREAVRRLLDGAEDAELIADIVSATLGLTPPEGFDEQVPWAFRRLLEVLARERPLMLVIDDVHWADPRLLDLVDYLIDWLTAPTLLVCLARPELLDVRPSWGGGHSRVSSVVVDPLKDEDAEQLLAHQQVQRTLTASESAQIIEVAEGNPLFAEQLLAMSAEDPRWTQGRQIPPTIQTLLAARLDRLGPGERAVIERAAVIGREFWQSAVVELLPTKARPSAGQHLRALVHRGLLQPGRSTMSGEETLRFHHILIRDVAYRGTPKTRRGELHERFADWLGRYGEGFEEFVGYHFEQAFQYKSELGRPDAQALELASRGGESLAAAGRRALARGDTNGGVKLLRRAAALFEAGEKARPDVMLDLGSALSESGDFSDAERVLESALGQAQATRAEAVSARALIELSYWHSRVDPGSRVAEMLTVARRAIELFERVDDQSGISRAWLHIAWAHWIQSHCAEMEQALERALLHAERAGNKREQPRILSDLARAAVIGPRPVPDGIKRCSAILERAGDDVAPAAFTGAMLAVLLAMDGRCEQARERWQTSKRRLAEVGLSFLVAVVQMYLAFIELLAGTPARAEPEVTEAFAAFERAGDQGRLSSAAALLGRLLYEQDRYDDAWRLIQISEETASEDDVVSQVVWRGTRAKLLARAGHGSAAEELASSGVAQAGASDFLMLHGDALRDRAEVLALVGKREQAAHDRERALGLYERKGIRLRA